MRTTDSRYVSLLAGTFLILLSIVMMARPCAIYAADQQIQLQDFVLDNTDGQIAVRFGIGIGELDQLRLMLKEGGKITLSCEATLSQPGTLWLGETLTQQGLVSTLSYNVLTREYVLTLSNKKVLFKNTSLPKLLAETWETLSLNVGQLSNLQRGEDYRIDLKIDIQKDNVPPWLAKTLFFWSWDVAPSMHYSMNFTF